MATSAGCYEYSAAPAVGAIQAPHTAETVHHSLDRGCRVTRGRLAGNCWQRQNDRVLKRCPLQEFEPSRSTGDKSSDTDVRGRCQQPNGRTPSDCFLAASVHFRSETRRAWFSDSTASKPPGRPARVKCQLPQGTRTFAKQGQNTVKLKPRSFNMCAKKYVALSIPLVDNALTLSIWPV